MFCHVSKQVCYPYFYYISACHTTISINISDIGESILTFLFYDFSIRFWNCSDIVVFVCFSLYLTLYTSLTHPLFTEVPIPIKDSERSCICESGVYIFPFSMIFLLAYGTTLTVYYFWSY